MTRAIPEFPSRKSGCFLWAANVASSGIVEPQSVSSSRRRARWSMVAIVATALVAMSSWPAVIPARHYTTADGLARDSVHCILRDRNSFLWFATGEGISRFDGYGFTNYRVTDGLPDRDVRAIVEARDGSFLVATGGGAARFDPYGQAGRPLFVPYVVDGGYKTQSVRSGRAVDAQSAARLEPMRGCLSSGSRSQIFRLANSTEQPRSSAWRGREGNLWFGSSRALYVLREKSPCRRWFPDACRRCWRKEHGGGRNGNWLIRVGADGKVENLAPAPLDRTVLSLLRSRDGTLWEGTSRDVGHLEPGGKAYRWLGDREGLAHAEVRGLAEDANGDIWVGSMERERLEFRRTDL